MRSDLMRELRTASIDVGSKGLSQEDANKYITERAGDFLRSNIYEPALKAKSEDFGYELLSTGQPQQSFFTDTPEPLFFFFREQGGIYMVLNCAFAFIKPVQYR